MWDCTHLSHFLIFSELTSLKMFTVAKYKQCNLNKVIIVLYEQTSTLRSIQLAAQLNFYCPLMK
jgi:hypothetical protein